MSTWALLHKGKLKQFLKHEKAIWSLRADSWNIPSSPGHCLVASHSRTPGSFLGGFSRSISSSMLLFQPQTQLSLNLCNPLVEIEVPSPLFCSLSLSCFMTEEGCLHLIWCGWSIFCSSIPETGKIRSLGLSSLGSAINLLVTMGKSGNVPGLQFAYL